MTQVSWDRCKFNYKKYLFEVTLVDTLNDVESTCTELKQLVNSIVINDCYNSSFVGSETSVYYDKESNNIEVIVRPSGGHASYYTLLQECEKLLTKYFN